MNVARRIAALSLSLFVAPSALGASRPMSLDDILTAVRVGDPQLSPDGRRVAYVRTVTEPGSLKRNGDIWLVNADGTGRRRLTTHEKSDSTPRFSPKGDRLAFLSSRGGSPQVWVIDLSGGEPRKVTDLPTGAQAPLVWSPDGKKLAVVADTYPSCADLACVKKRVEEAEANPVKAYHLKRLLHRHWDEWRPEVRKHVFLVDVETGAAGGPGDGAVVDLTPGDYDSPTVQYEDGAVAFSPDGAEIAFVSNREGNDREAFSTNMDVWTVPVAGGTPKKVGGNPAADVTPVYSPDGKTLAVKAQRRAGFEADRFYLDLYDRASGQRRTLFPDVDLSVGDFAFSTDGKTVYFTAEKDARTNLYAVDANAPAAKPRLVLTGGHLGSLSVAADFVLFSKTTLTSPAELFRTSLDGKDVRALTSENAAVWKDLKVAEPESRTARSKDGAQVQYWLVRPPDFDPAKKYPAVFLIHGGPQGAWEDGWSYRWCPALWAARGYVIVAPNPRGSSGFGQKYLDDVSLDWGGKVMDDLNAVFDAVVGLPFVDGARTGIAGASYGGYAVNWLIGQTDRFKAAVTHDGVFNLESMALTTEELWFPDWEFGGEPWGEKAQAQYARYSPHRFVHKVKTPTLVITNELDYRVPVDQGLQLFTALRRRGVPCEALVFPDEGHWVLKPHNSRKWHETVFAWLDRWLK